LPILAGAGRDLAFADGASFDRGGGGSARDLVNADPLPRGPLALFDDAHRFRVRSMAARTRLDGCCSAAQIWLPAAPDSLRGIQFGHAELTGDSIYELSRLLRGQGGSEWAIADPLPTGSGFVLLDEQVVPVARGLDMLGRPLSLRIVAAQRDHGDPVRSRRHTPGAAAFVLPPVSARRRTAGVMLSFVRRTRIDGDSGRRSGAARRSAKAEIDILMARRPRTLSSASPVLTPCRRAAISRTAIRVDPCVPDVAVASRGHAAL
jgi:hypothetical protein